MMEDQGRELSRVAIPLLKGVLYRDEDEHLWGLLLRQQARLRDYVAVLGLELMLDEAEGYAFLRSRHDLEAEGLPRLLPRRPLPYPVSLLLALLRRRLAEFDAKGPGGETRLILSREDVVELIRVFLPDGSNEARLVEQVDRLLNRTEEMGFVRRLRGEPRMIEVRRIVKAFFDAEWLGEFEARLAEYANMNTAGTAETVENEDA